MTTVAKDLRVFAGGVKETGGQGAGADGHEAAMASGSTTNNTATVLAAIPVGEDELVIVRAFGGALRDTGAEALWTDAVLGFRRDGSGNVTAVGSVNTRTANDSSGTPTITLVANTTDQTVDVTVTGETSKNFEWALRYEVLTRKV